MCDSLVDARGQRPPPPAPGQLADVPLFATLYKDELVLYRDMSGDSLHRWLAGWLAGWAGGRLCEA